MDLMTRCDNGAGVCVPLLRSTQLPQYNSIKYLLSLVQDSRFSALHGSHTLAKILVCSNPSLSRKSRMLSTSPPSRVKVKATKSTSYCEVMSRMACTSCSLSSGRSACMLPLSSGLAEWCVTVNSPSITASFWAVQMTSEPSTDVTSSHREDSSAPLTRYLHQQPGCRQPTIQCTQSFRNMALKPLQVFIVSEIL